MILSRRIRLALCILPLLGGCSLAPPALPLGGGQGALGGLGGAAMTDHAVGSGASVNDILSRDGTSTSGPGGIYPPLQ